jgi:hypothetical protein
VQLADHLGLPPRLSGSLDLNAALRLDERLLQQFSVTVRTMARLAEHEVERSLFAKHIGDDPVERMIRLVKRDIVHIRRSSVLLAE